MFYSASESELRSTKAMLQPCLLTLFLIVSLGASAITKEQTRWNACRDRIESLYAKRGLCGSSGCKTDSGKDVVVAKCGKNPSFKNKNKICSYVFANIYMERRNNIKETGPVNDVYGLEKQWLELLPDYQEDFYLTTVNSSYTLSRKEFGDIFCRE